MRLPGPSAVWTRVVPAALGALLVLGQPVPASAALVGSVSGLVTGDGQPLANAWVAFIPVTPTGDWAGRGGVTSTDALGRYRFPDLYVDHVKIQVRAPVSGGFAATYWPAAHTFAAAGVLRVTASGVVADVDLVRGGSVRGQVVDAATGLPVVGARVTAHPVSGAGWESLGSPALGVDAGPGGFAIQDLPPIPVALQAHAPPGSNHLSTWYDGASFLDLAQPIDGAADTEQLLVRMPEGAQLSGTVRDDRGEPVAGAAVTLIGCPGLCPLMALTDASGAYRIPAIPPGQGMLVHASADAQGHVPQWYRRPGQSQEARLALAGGQARSGIDLVLARGAFLTATVVDDRTGSPLDGIAAELTSLTNPLLGYLPGTRDGLIARATGSEDDPAGTFTIGPAPPGTYRLVVYPGTSNRQYLPVTWAPSRGIDQAGVVRLGPGDRHTAVVRLVRRSATAPGGGGRPGPTRPQSGSDGAGDLPAEPSTGNQGGWPGLFGGFLAAPAGGGWLG